jgi:xanthine dehydrogenase molybdopterin-binding subunit B
MVLTRSSCFALGYVAVALQAVGEPPFHLGAAVFFALKDAVYAARADAGATGGLVYTLGRVSQVHVSLHVETRLLRGQDDMLETGLR